jgi:hypothetical protein
MRATDVVRQVLDLLDSIENSNSIDSTVIVKQNGETDNRFRQILAMLNADSFGTYSNSPNEVVADINSVTTLAGGGVNGPKHPADIRVKDPGYGHGS